MKIHEVDFINNIKKRTIMRAIFIVFYTLLIFGCISCKKQVQKEKQKQIVHKTVALKNNYIGKAGPIIKVQNKIIGIDFFLDSCFYYIDLKSNELHRFGTKGQGTNDFLYPYTLQYLSEKKFGVYDLMTRKFSEISIDDSIKIIQQYLISKDIMSFDFKKLSKNTFLGFGPYKKEMFIITDSLGKRKGSFYELPYLDNHEKTLKHHIRAMAYQGLISNNPSNDKFVYTSTWGEIFHLYKQKNDSLKIIQKVELSYPRYTIEENKEGFGAPLKLNNKAGYIANSATDQYIFLLYSGTTLEEFVKNKEEICGNKIIIYNWDGEKIKEFELDLKCRYIIASKDNKILWGIANNPDPELVYFELPTIE